MMCSKAKIILLLFGTFLSQLVYAQLTMKNGASLSVKEGTIIDFISIQDSLIISDNSTIQNDGIIRFMDGNYLREQPGFPISGKGYESSSLTNVTQPFNLNSGNLGLKISNSTSTFQNLIIKRYHSDTLMLINNTPSIKRFYHLDYDSLPQNLDITLQYDSTEKNSLNQPYLSIINFDTSTLYNLGGTPSTDSLFVSSSSSSKGFYTLAETYLTIDSILPTAFCPRDTMSINLTTIGIFNPNNYFIYYLMDGANDTILSDTTYSANFNVVIPEVNSFGNYEVTVASSSPKLTALNPRTISIYPTVNFSLGVTPTSACDNIDSLLLSIEPSGGNYSGSYIMGNYFYPDTSNVGIQNIGYHYIDTNGCSHLFEHQIEVLASPMVTIGSNSALCENSDPILLNSGSPSGGTYSGNGILNNEFDPMMAGIGIHNISYSYMAVNGCSNTSIGQIEVLPVANIQSQDSSVCFSGDSLLLNYILPIGGVFTSSLVNTNYFLISDATIGSHEVFYSYLNSNGCISIDSFQINVNDNPIVSISAFDPICQNEASFPIVNGSPSGGTYTGLGISNNIFNPGLTGQGQFLVTYTFTNTNNCSSSDTASITVLPSPSIPIITQNLNILSSTNAPNYQWYFNGTLLTGEVNQFITATNSGFYQVEVTEINGCSEISQPYNFQTNSIEEQNNIPHLTLYPNPSNGIFVIEKLNKESLDITIFDVTGKLLFTTKMIDSAIEVNLEGLETGIYFLESRSNSVTQIIKFMVL